MDWSHREPPTAESIAGCGVIEQGHVHIKAIRETGGEVLGFRDLALDGIEPALFRDAWMPTYVQRGFEWLRPFHRRRDAGLPVFPTWGYDFIRRLAEMHFGGRRRGTSTADPDMGS
jgi:hypothetical protein